MRRHELVYSLNAGAVDPKALTRVDLEKSRLAGEHPIDNMLPEVLGPLGLRPGSESLFRIPGDAEVRQRRFQHRVGTGYVLLFTASTMRVSLNGVIQQVPSVATAIATGSWTDQSSGSATATGGATLTLNATLTAYARLRQSVSVASGDQAKVNILRVVVTAGPVFLRIGTSAGSANLMPNGVDAELDVGTHKIGVTPGAGTIYIDVTARDAVTRTVSEIQFESTLIGGTGDLTLPTPWSTMASIDALRSHQSIDVMFIGDGISQQRKIEHRGPLSWGIALYRTADGPFIQGDSKITLTPAAVSGNTTLTASEPFFLAGHAGAVIETTQAGKTVSATFDGPDLTTDYITVVGVGAGRVFRRIAVDSSFDGTFIIERSFEPSDPSIWSTYATYTSGTSFNATDNDNQDNLTVHYRFRVTAYTSGSVDVTLKYSAGVSIGRSRITSVGSATSVNVEVLQRLGNTTATRQWRISDWSDARGWPRVPVIHDGRMHWFRGDRDYASLPDDYASYNDRTIGDGAPFVRSVGSGGEDGVLWALSEARLLTGTSAFEAVIAASEFDGPLTPTDYTVRKPSRRGCADVQAIPHDDGIFFVQRSRKKLYEIAMGTSGRFASTNISRLNPEAFRSGIKRIAVQQQPDTRCYCYMDDGSVTVMTWEREDKVAAITSISIAGGAIEDIVTMPMTDQDDIYLIVNRGGKRYQERLAKEDQQWDVATCALLDGHKVLTGSISQITGADRFANETVQVWADGRRRPDVALNGSGVGSLGATYSRVVYGKRYYGRYKSVKLAYAAQLGTAVGQTKIVRGAGLILANSCLDGIQIGPDETTTEGMPDIVDGAERTPNQFFEHYDKDIFPINSDWTPDARLFVRVDSAEGPCTLAGIVLDIETRDGAAEAA